MLGPLSTAEGQQQQEPQSNTISTPGRWSGHKLANSALLQQQLGLSRVTRPCKPTERHISRGDFVQASDAISGLPASPENDTANDVDEFSTKPDDCHDNVVSSEEGESHHKAACQPAQLGLCKSQSLKPSESALGLWQQSTNFHFHGSNSSSIDTARRTLLDRWSPFLSHLSPTSKSQVIVPAEWRRSGSKLYAAKQKKASPLTSTIAVRSCDPAVVHAGYLGAPMRPLRSAASLPAIRQSICPPAPMTISSAQHLQ